MPKSPHLSSSLQHLKGLLRYRISSQSEIGLKANQFSLAVNPAVAIVCGFGSVKYSEASLRLSKQLKSLDCFEQVFCFSHILEVPGLVGEQSSLLIRFASQYPRGWGLWAWKPVVISAIMNQLPEHCEVFYFDAGCEVSPQGLRRFATYRAIVQQKGYLFFSIPFLERHWTSAEVFDFFGLSHGLTHFQVQASWFGLLNTEKNRHLVSEWEDACLVDNGRLLLAKSPNANPNLIAHREDQSILSCLLALHGCWDGIPHEDHFAPYLYYPGSWILNWPVHTLRSAGAQSVIETLAPASQCQVSLISKWLTPVWLSMRALRADILLFLSLAQDSSRNAGG